MKLWKKGRGQKLLAVDPANFRGGTTISRRLCRTGSARAHAPFLRRRRRNTGVRRLHWYGRRGGLRPRPDSSNRSSQEQPLVPSVIRIASVRVLVFVRLGFARLSGRPGSDIAGRRVFGRPGVFGATDGWGRRGSITLCHPSSWCVRPRGRSRFRPGLSWSRTRPVSFWWRPFSR